MKALGVTALLLACLACGDAAPGRAGAWSSPTPSRTPSTADYPVVPWAPRPRGEHAPGGSGTLRQPSTARLCEAADVRGSMNVTEGDHGRLMLHMRLERVGDEPCRIADEAEGAVLDGEGKRLDSGAGGGARPYQFPPPTVEARHTIVTLGYWHGWCGDPPAAPWHVRLMLGSTQVDLPPQYVAPPACPSEGSGGFNFTTYTVLDEYEQPVGAAMAALRMDVEVPTRVARGDVLRYRLVLHNPSKRELPLDPCPSFAVSLGKEGPKGGPDEIVGSWQLNCPAAPTAIAAGSGMVFLMETPMNRRLEWGSELGTGPHRLVWNFVDVASVAYFGPGAGTAPLEIT